MGFNGQAKTTFTIAELMLKISIRVISKIRSLKEEAVAAPTVNVGSLKQLAVQQKQVIPPKVKKKKRYIYIIK